jgi:hypothetical protein
MFQEATFIWFDIFSRRQHKAAQPGSAALVAATSELVAATRSVAVVLHPFDAPLSLRRAWCDARCRPLLAIVCTHSAPHCFCRCFFELYCCMRNGGKLHVALTPGESDRIAEQSEAGAGAAADLAAFHGMLSMFDMRSAACTVKEDQVSGCRRMSLSAAPLRPDVAVACGTLVMTHALQAAIFQELENDPGIEHVDRMVKQGLVAWLESQQQEPAAHAEEEMASARAEASALYAAAKKHHDSNLFSEGEQLARRAVDARERVLGAANIETLAAKLLLASLLKKQKRLDEAKSLYEEVLAAARQELGSDHEETLGCMNNLAVLLKQQGKLDDARALYEEALGFKRAKLGAQHASTLTSMGNLAGLLKAQGKFEEARVLYEESLRGRRSALGPLHPDTLTDIWNFALFLNKVV